MPINRIICGDAIEEMKKIPTDSIDCILTDPPYNALNIGPQKRVYSLGTMQLPLKEYKKFCKNWFREALRISKRIIFTPGIANVCYYPQPHWIICWHKPASVSFNRMGGYNAWEPIFVYGKMPKGKRLGQDYILCNTLNFSKGPEKKHPCPKPPELWGKLVDKFSIEGETILDPFIGSGTTAIMARKFSRNFLGIENNPEYIKICMDRLSQQSLI